MGYFGWAFPCGSHYPLYLFCLIRTKKDVAAIANATSDIQCSKVGIRNTKDHFKFEVVFLINGIK